MFQSLMQYPTKLNVHAAARHGSQKAEAKKEALPPSSTSKDEGAFLVVIFAPLTLFCKFQVGPLTIHCMSKSVRT